MWRGYHLRASVPERHVKESRRILSGRSMRIAIDSRALPVAALLASVIVGLSARSAVAATPAPPPISEFSLRPLSGGGGGDAGSMRELGHITVGPDANLWFTESPSKVGRITPTGIITEIGPVPTGVMGDIVTGSDGNLWFTASDVNAIGRMRLLG